MKKRKRILAGILAAMLASLLGGCKNTADNAARQESSQVSKEAGGEETDAESVSYKSTENNGTAMGRYVESTLALWEDAGDILDMGVLKDSTLRLVTGEDGRAGVYDSADGGATWEKTMELGTSIQDTDQEQLSTASISPDGSVFCAIWRVQQEEQEETAVVVGDGEAFTFSYRYEKVSPDGAATDVPFLENASDDLSNAYLYMVTYAETGKLLVLLTGGEGRIFLVDDATGKILKTYNEEGAPADYFFKAGDHLYLISASGVTVLDYATGETVETDETLADTLEAKKDGLESTTIYSYPVCLCAGTQDGELYYCSEEGIFHYVQGGSVVEQLADGSLNSLSRPSVMLMRLCVLADGSILTAGGNPAATGKATSC